MKINYSVNVEEFVAFNRFHWERSPYFRQTVAALRWYLPLGLTSVAGLFLLADHGSLPVAFGLLCGAAFLVVATPRILRRSLDRQVRNMFAEGSNKAFFGAHELEIDDSGLVERSAFGESRFRWEAVERIEATPDHVFIYLSAVHAIAISRSSVSGCDIEAFVAALKERHAACRA